MNNKMFQDSNGVWWDGETFGDKERLREARQISATEYEIGRRSLRIDLFKQGRGDYRAVDLVAQINEALAKAPEASRDNAVFEIGGSWDEYGDEPWIKIYYDTLETDEELQARKDALKQEEAARIVQRERAERTTLAKLKAKYEAR